MNSCAKSSCHTNLMRERRVPANSGEATLDRPNDGAKENNMLFMTNLTLMASIKNPHVTRNRRATPAMGNNKKVMNAHAMTVKHSKMRYTDTHHQQARVGSHTH